MERARISDEWLIGATLGAYLFFTFVMYFWGSAFIHFWCGNSPYPFSTRDGRFPVHLWFLIPAAIVCILNWVQTKAVRSELVSYRTVRAALWTNLLGILALLIAVARNYGPDRIDFFGIIGLLGMALWPMGFLVSVGNLAWACVQWVRPRQPRTISS